MGQHRILGLVAAVAVAVAGSVLVGRWSCKPLVQTPSKQIRIASITPAGTDLVIGIGAADRIVGVSNFDSSRPQIAGKPRVGDYQNINWEKLASIRANVLLLQYGRDRAPDYIQQRCAEMGIRIVNLKLDTIDEILGAMDKLGDVVGEPEKAQQTAAVLETRLAILKALGRGLPRPRTLIVTDDESFSLAGPGEFLDEILQIAGGQNAAESLGKPYPSVDREMILSMAPDVVIRLIPNGDGKPQVVRAGDRIWNSMPDLPAMKNHRVYVVTDWYGELPGTHVADLAEELALILRPK